MKTKSKALIRFIPLVVILILLCFWRYMTEKPFDTLAYVIVGLIILIVGFSLYFKINSLKNEKAGLTPEDELSKRIKEKAAAEAFKFSIYMWVFGVLFLVDMEPRSKIIVGLGLLLTGIFFFVTWFYLSKVGISDENKN